MIPIDVGRMRYHPGQYVEPRPNGEHHMMYRIAVHPEHTLHRRRYTMALENFLGEVHKQLQTWTPFMILMSASSLAKLADWQGVKTHRLNLFGMAVSAGKVDNDEFMVLMQPQTVGHRFDPDTSAKMTEPAKMTVKIEDSPMAQMAVVKEYLQQRYDDSKFMPEKRIIRKMIDELSEQDFKDQMAAQIKERTVQIIADAFGVPRELLEDQQPYRHGMITQQEWQDRRRAERTASLQAGVFYVPPPPFKIISGDIS